MQNVSSHITVDFVNVIYEFFHKMLTLQTWCVLREKKNYKFNLILNYHNHLRKHYKGKCFQNIIS